MEKFHKYIDELRPYSKRALHRLNDFARKVGPEVRKYIGPKDIKRALIVDNDGESWREIIDFVKSLGYKVSTIHHSRIAEVKPAEFDLVVLSGGFWYDESKLWHSEYDSQLEMIRKAKTPIVGVCLGFQLVNIAFGAEAKLLKVAMHGMGDIEISEDFHRGKTMRVFKNHVRGVFAPGQDLEVLARSKQGNIEIVLHNSLPIAGVQYHPEKTDTEESREVFAALIDRITKIK